MFLIRQQLLTVWLLVLRSNPVLLLLNLKIPQSDSLCWSYAVSPAYYESYPIHLLCQHAQLVTHAPNAHSLKTKKNINWHHFWHWYFAKFSLLFSLPYFHLPIISICLTKSKYQPAFFSSSTLCKKSSSGFSRSFLCFTIIRASSISWKSTALS